MKPIVLKILICSISMLSQHYVNVATSAILRILSVSLLVALFNVAVCLFHGRLSKVKAGPSGRSATAAAPMVTGMFFSRGCSRGRTRYARIIDIMVVIEPPPRTDVGWIRGTSVMNAAAASSVRHKMVPESVKARPETQLDNIKIWCDTVNFPFCRSALLQ